MISFKDVSFGCVVTVADPTGKKHRMETKEGYPDFQVLFLFPLCFLFKN